MPRATAVLREKVIDENGNILELVIWRVPKELTQPERGEVSARVRTAG